MKRACLVGLLLSGVSLILCVPSEAQNVVTDWNAIASTTIVANGGKASGSSAVWFAYASIAVYDAVNAVRQGRFEPFYYRGAAPDGASDAAAAVAAAHRVLVSYFPAQQTQLDTQFNKSLDAITASSSAKSAGVTVGEAAAAAVIATRVGDGLEANVLYTPGTGPGVWQPTPPGFLPALTPWMGQMRPFTMKSPGQFLPLGPASLAGEQWVAEFNEVRLFGGTNSTLRTAAQTEIGRFWAVHTGQQYAQAFGLLAQNYNLDLLDSARLLAMLWTGFADAGIGCWNAKFTYNFWRPVTAINNGGGNPELTADVGWTALGTTPNHPEYPSAHGCVTGAVAALVEDFFGTPKVRVVVDSTGFSDGTHRHTFESTPDWLNEVYWARVFAGFHYHRSLDEGVTLGRKVAAQVFAGHFRRSRLRAASETAIMEDVPIPETRR